MLPSITQVFIENGKPQLTKQKPDLPSRKFRAENNFLRFRRNSHKRTMVMLPSTTQIIIENGKPQLTKKKTRLAGPKCSCRKEFSPISTKLTQNNNGDVPIH